MPLRFQLTFVAIGWSVLALPAWGQTSLRVEVVDDTGDTDSPYVLVVGEDAGGDPLSVDFGPGFGASPLPAPPLANSGLTMNSAVPVKIEKLQSANYSVTSPYTGLSRPVYFFTVTTLKSGVFMVFKNDGSGSPPFTYVNNTNPSASLSNYRFDLCEITFDANIQSGADLTSIDAFSMPMQLELFTGTAPNLTLVDARKYYLSTESLAAAFRDAGAGQALYKLGTGGPSGTPVRGWTPADGMSQFVRALGPGQVSANNDGDPYPYPSFAAYLQSLAALPSAAGKFTVTSNVNVGAYNYSGSVSSDGHGGYQMLLTGTADNAAPLSNNLPMTINLPTTAPATAVGVGSAVGTLTTINVTDGGSGYNNPPIVTVIAPFIVPASAKDVTVAGGAVTGVDILFGGSGYTSPPTVTFNSLVGSGAVATAILTKGAVTGVSITNGGTGYSGPPTAAFSAPPDGTPATATAIVSGGAVTGFTITNLGAGYTNTASVTIDPPAGSMDTFLYGAALSADVFSLQGIPYATVQANTGGVYGSIARDALAAINFGYLNSKYGTTNATWFGATPTSFPYGLARATNDGYYNPWAALVYNNSDAYGFAFSDRSGPSPLIGLAAGNPNAQPSPPAPQTLRITLLPDSRLDSPKPTVTPSTNSLAIQWPAVTGAQDYLVSVLAPSGIPAVWSMGMNSCTLTGLSPGTPYTITVAATAALQDPTIKSPAQPIQVSTSGSLQSNAGGSFNFQMSMSWIPGGNIAPTPTANFNNQTLTYNASTMQWLQGGLNAQLSGATGLAGVTVPNQYVMTVYDGNNAVLFSNIFTIALQTPASGPMNVFSITDASLYGNAGALTGYSPTATYASGSLVFGVPFNPIPLKAFAPVSFPTLGYDQWREGFPAFTNNAPGADADGDGISNLMEYFQGSDPTDPGLFETSTTNVTATETLFTYRQSERISGVTAQVEWSTDLQTWNVDGVTTDPPQDVGGHLEFTAHVPRAGEPVMFTRLRVTLNQARSANGMPAETAKASSKAHDDNSPPPKTNIPRNSKTSSGKLTY